jgi:hypothetical protein
VATDILMLFTLKYDANPPSFQGGLHARSDLELLRPVFVGQKVTIAGRTTEKYQKRGQNYRALEGEVRNEAGEVCVRMRATETMGLASDTPVGKRLGTPSADAITGEIPAGTPVAARAAHGVALGAAIPAVTKHTSLEQSVLYSGFPHGWADGGARSMWVNIHTDPEDGASTASRMPWSGVDSLPISPKLRELLRPSCYERPAIHRLHSSGHCAGCDHGGGPGEAG